MMPRLLSLLLCACALPALAQWPTRPVRFLVPFIAGSAPDVIARQVAEQVAPRLGQPVVIENRGGAGGNLGFEAGARAAPDGYTFVLGTNSLVINPALYARVPFDPLRDFVTVNLTFAMPHILVVPNALPAATVAEFVTLIQREPGRHNYGSGGNGSGAHLAAELLRLRAQLQVVHVPYRGAPDIIRAVLANEVSFGLPTLATATQLVRAGQLRALAHAGAARNPTLPDVPTLGETFPGFELTSWFGFVAPGGTPETAVNQLDQAIRAALADPAFRDRATADGTIAVGMPAAAFATFLRAEQAKWAEAVRISGARVD